ncbi:hypothetical protein LCGC14_3121290 [marine sediment metagenome]|uniref:Uncharacterized protein n=1 Tax=marine sediment metagenome TaxID=412755 RepID=A0A0F8YS11_9ZZZZ
MSRYRTIIVLERAILLNGEVQAWELERSEWLYDGKDPHAAGDDFDQANDGYNLLTILKRNR